MISFILRVTGYPALFADALQLEPVRLACDGPACHYCSSTIRHCNLSRCNCSNWLIEHHPRLVSANQCRSLRGHVVSNLHADPTASFWQAGGPMQALQAGLAL